MASAYGSACGIKTNPLIHLLDEAIAGGFAHTGRRIFSGLLHGRIKRCKTESFDQRFIVLRRSWQGQKQKAQNSGRQRRCHLA